MEVASLVGNVFMGLGKTIIGALTFDAGMIKEGIVQSATAAASIMDGGIKKAFNKGYDNSMAESAAKAATEDISKAQEKKTTNVYAKPNNKVQAVLDAANGKKDKSQNNSERISGSTPRTVNINIDSIIKGDWITKNEQFQNMGKAEVEKYFTELIMRMQHNAEMGYN